MNERGGERRERECKIGDCSALLLTHVYIHAELELH